MVGTQQQQKIAAFKLDYPTMTPPTATCAMVSSSMSIQSGVYNLLKMVHIYKISDYVHTHNIKRDMCALILLIQIQLMITLKYRRIYPFDNL